MRKVLLASLMVSVMGLSSLFAEDKEATQVDLTCGCPAKKGEIKNPAPAEEVEVKVSVSTEEDLTTKAVSCGECDKGDKLKGEEEAEEFSVS